MVNSATFDNGGGGSTERSVTIDAGPYGTGSSFTSTWVKFEGTVTALGSNVEGGTYTDDEAKLDVGGHRDTAHGTGTVTVWNTGSYKPDREPTQVDVLIAGAKVATLAPGEKYVEGTGVTDGTGQDDGTVPNTDGGREWASQNENVTTTGTGGDLLGLVPSLLPGIGPLTSKQTTVLAIVLLIGAVGLATG